MKKLLLLLALALVATFSGHGSLAQGNSEGVQSAPEENRASAQRVSPSSVFRLIVHPKTPFDEISSSRLSQILLKKKTTWPDGKRTFPVDLGGRSKVREALSRQIHGRSVASIKSFWQRQIFSGRSVPPPELDSDQEVLAFVQRQPGAVGYISSQTPFDGVKELFLVEE